jgi:competence protein ComEA
MFAAPCCGREFIVYLQVLGFIRLLRRPGELSVGQTLHDGQKIEIPVSGSAASAQSTGKRALSNGSVNLNTADEGELDTLPGVGPATARKIIEYRDKNGSFRHTDDLMKIPGIGRKKYDKLKDHVCIN